MITRASVMLAILLALGLGGAHASSTPRFLGCRAYTGSHAPGAVKPRSIIAACADGNFWFGALRWSSWSAAGAHALGTAHVNDCKPYCAAGHFHTYPVTVSLAVAKSCDGKIELTRLAWRFTRAKPRSQPRSGSESFRCA